MSGHTKGPWRVGCEAGFNASFVYGSDTTVASVFGIFINRDLEEVASDPRCAEGLANARLIAAAPDLLEAAQWAEKALERYSDALGLDVDEAALIALTKITAAITRADGGGK